MPEQWVSWDPLAHIHGGYYIDNLVDGLTELALEFEILGGESEQNIRLLFEEPVFFYRICDELSRSKTIATLCAQHLRGVEKGSVFKVSNSLLLRELALPEKSSVTHFGIIEVNWVIDIVATVDPKIEWL